MKVTPDQLARITPVLASHAPALLAAAERYQINTPLRLAHWLAQMAHESDGFESMEESLNYKADSKMMQKFIGWGRISKEDAQKFGKTADHPAHQNALANILYGGSFGLKQLGNTQPGDGWRFRGRGYKQITGRDNYARGSQRVFKDDRLVQNPDLAAQPEFAAMLAADFWDSKKLNPHADRDDIEAITRIINGGDTGLKERKEWLVRAKKALGLP